MVPVGIPTEANLRQNAAAEQVSGIEVSPAALYTNTPLILLSISLARSFARLLTHSFSQSVNQSVSQYVPSLAVRCVQP